jgi:hypothetical protein
MRGAVYIYLFIHFILLSHFVLALVWLVLFILCLCRNESCFLRRLLLIFELAQEVRKEYKARPPKTYQYLQIKQNIKGS